PLRIEGEGASIKEDLIIRANLIDINHWNAELTRDIPMNTFSSRTLAPLVGARRNRKNKLRTHLAIASDRITPVNLAPLSRITRPKVFADRNRDRSSIAVPELNF